MNTTTGLQQLPFEAKTFRHRRYYLIVGVVCTLYFAFMGFTSTAVAYLNVDGSFPRPFLFATVSGVFWSGFTLMAVWVVAAYFRERLFVGGDAIIQQGVLRRRTLRPDDVRKVEWSVWPAREIVTLRTRSRQIRIYLNNFTKGERDLLVFFCRKTFAEGIQENWPHFEERARRSTAPGITFTRGGVIAIASVLTCFAGAFVYCWSLGSGKWCLVIGVVNVVAAVCCLWRLPYIRSRSSAHESMSREGKLPL